MTRYVTITLGLGAACTTALAALWMGGSTVITEDYTINIDRKPDQVFGVLTDIDMLPKWVEGVREVQTVKKTPEVVGTIDRVITKDMTIESEVLVYEPGKAFHVRSTMPGLPGVLRYTLEPHGAGTRLNMKSEFKPESLGMKLLRPFIAWQLRKHRPGQMERFKAVVEANT